MSHSKSYRSCCRAAWGTCVFLLALPAAAEDGCRLAPLEAVMVGDVRDGRTLSLVDGRLLRLAAIEVVDSTSAVLRQLAVGKTLRLARLGPDRDRYGRLVAFAYPGKAQETLQQTLLQAGLARVSARVGDKACAEALLAAERKARAAQRGLWADPNFAPLQSDNFAGLASRVGEFALVEGKVLSVHQSGATIYLNFGRRWTRDFSVIILRRNLRGFSAAGIEPKQLAGHRIRVRGFIEQRGGPAVEADVPEQIERLD